MYELTERMDIGMNMNVNVKQIKRISAKVIDQIDEMTIKNLDQLNDKIDAYFTPYSDGMNEIVMEVYSHPYMTAEQFKDYTLAFVELSKMFNAENRDEIMLKLSENTIKANSHMLHEALDLLMEELCEIGVPYNRAVLEFKKQQNNAVSRTQRFFNDNYKETCKRFRDVCEFCFDAMLDYGDSRVIDSEDEIVDVVEIELESNKRLIRTDNVYDIIELAESNGFREERQCGSHKIFKNNNGQIVVIPVHGKTINVGLAFTIQKQIYSKVA